MITMKQKTKDRISAFWDAHPCGTAFTSHKDGTKEFFDCIENLRYGTHRHIPELLDFSKYKDKRVLEIGCGIGTDLRQFAHEGGKTVGVDLSRKSVTLAKRGFELYGYVGDFLVGDGENLGFKDNSFDFVYSFGVLHHTPNTQKAIDEIYRVLKPNGETVVMLYYQKSFNVALRIFLLRGVLEKKFKILSMQELLNQSTEGLGNPLTKIYSRKDAKKMFHQFALVKTYVRYLTPSHMPIVGKHIPRQFFGLLEEICGWHLLIRAVKGD